MTPQELRKVAVAAAFPTVNVRALQHIIEGAAEEAWAGLTVTRVVTGWRVIIDRELAVGGGGSWLITASPISTAAVPVPGFGHVAVPPEVLAVAGCIAADAGAPLDFVSKYDEVHVELRIEWKEPPKP